MRVVLFMLKGIVGGPLALLFGAVGLMAMPLVLILLAGNALFDGRLFGNREECDK
jgi:hypothetical protein